MELFVGYKLISKDNVVIQSWGGIWGQFPSIPNPITLPNGDIIYGPTIDTAYGDWTLVEWKMEEPPPQIPSSITPRQCRLLLLQQNLLADVEAMIAQQDAATKITWEYALEYLREDALLNQIAVNLGLTKEQIDEFFIEAAKL